MRKASGKCRKISYLANGHRPARIAQTENKRSTRAKEVVSCRLGSRLITADASGGSGGSGRGDFGAFLSYRPYFCRKQDLNEFQRQRGDHRSIRFDTFRNQTVVEITANYYASYSVELMEG
jgi:hypothetical protein